jgi:hypothetical protein
MLDYLATAGLTKTYDQFKEEAPDLVRVPPFIFPRHNLCLSHYRQTTTRTRQPRQAACS